MESTEQPIPLSPPLGPADRRSRYHCGQSATRSPTQPIICTGQYNLLKGADHVRWDLLGLPKFTYLWDC